MTMTYDEQTQRRVSFMIQVILRVSYTLNLTLTNSQRESEVTLFPLQIIRLTNNYSKLLGKNKRMLPARWIWKSEPSAINLRSQTLKTNHLFLVNLQ